jgi:hypothetical protein
MSVLDIVSATPRQPQTQAARPTPSSKAKHKPNIRLSFGRLHRRKQRISHRPTCKTAMDGISRIDSPGREADTNLPTISCRNRVGKEQSQGGHLKLLTEEEKWDAVRGRNRLCDGSFVFAVRSTGIYCNPSCPAKRPAMKQVLFFSTPAEAKRSGFRPCRRCKPNENVKSPQVLMIERLRIYVENNLDKKLTLSTLSAEAGISPYHLQPSNGSLGLPRASTLKASAWQR